VSSPFSGTHRMDFGSNQSVNFHCLPALCFRNFIGVSWWIAFFDCNPKGLVLPTVEHSPQGQHPKRVLVLSRFWFKILLPCSNGKRRSFLGYI
jgi:hypothetical protein